MVVSVPMFDTNWPEVGRITSKEINAGYYCPICMAVSHYLHVVFVVVVVVVASVIIHTIINGITIG